MLKLFLLYRSELKKYQLKDGYLYFFRWWRSLKNGASSVKDEQPWITFKTIDFLNTHLNSSNKIFEYGGGGSTLFFVNRVNEVVTVEHSKEWFGTLKEIIDAKKDKKWKGQFVLPVKGDVVQDPDISNPDHYSSDDVPSKGQNYRDYATFIDGYADAYFDCVLVDGRARPSCIKHAIPKIKTGGYLVLDNSDRDYYLKHTLPFIETYFKIEVNEFGPCPYLQHFTKTTIWKKVK